MTQTAAGGEPTGAAVPRIALRCALLGLAVNIAIFVAIAIAPGPKSASLRLWELFGIALLGFVFGLAAAPVSAVEMLGARRPPSGWRDATVGAATFAAALVAGVLAFFEGFYLEELLRSGSPSRAFSAVTSTFARMERVHLGRIALMAGAFALPFPIVALGRLRGIGLRRQVGRIVAVGGMVAIVVGLGAGADVGYLVAVLVPAVGIGSVLPFLYRAADLIEARLARWWLGRGAPSGQTPPKPSA